MTEQMKPSGIAWIGDIPENWAIKRISYMSDSRSGGTPDRNNINFWENGTIPWMSSGEVNKVHIYNTDELITETAIQNSSAKLIKANSIMVALNGQGKTKGMSAILKIDSTCNQSLCAITCYQEQLYYKYLFWCFQSMYLYLRQMSGDDVRDGLAASYVKKQKIPTPTVNEQQAIATFLDKQCGNIDSIAVDIEKQIEILQKYKKSLILETVTKGLDKSVPMKESGIDWIGRIPISWQCTKVKYSFMVVNGSTPESGDFGCWDGNINWITPADMKDTGTISSGERTITQFGYNSCGTTILPVGSIIISSRAPIGKINITTESLCTNQGCKSLIKNADNRYFYYLLLAGQDKIISLGQGTTFLELGTYDIKNLSIVVPQKSEQQAIADFLDEQCDKIDGITARLEKQIKILQKYKNSIIYEHVTGKKRVKEAQ